MPSYPFLCHSLFIHHPPLLTHSFTNPFIGIYFICCLTIVSPTLGLSIHRTPFISNLKSKMFSHLSNNQFIHPPKSIDPNIHSFIIHLFIYLFIQLCSLPHLCLSVLTSAARLSLSISSRPLALFRPSTCLRSSLSSSW